MQLCMINSLLCVYSSDSECKNENKLINNAAAIMCENEAKEL